VFQCFPLDSLVQQHCQADLLFYCSSLVPITRSKAMFHTGGLSFLKLGTAMPWLYVMLVTGSLVACWIITTLRLAYRADLSSLPGPKWARFTGLYRVYRLWSGQAPAVYLGLHETYGPIVRTGPNNVSIADPLAIPTIYGITSTFLKVIFLHDDCHFRTALTVISPDFIKR
jgi:hypothetical protein